MSPGKWIVLVGLGMGGVIAGVKLVRGEASWEVPAPLVERKAAEGERGAMEAAAQPGPPALAAGEEAPQAAPSAGEEAELTVAEVWLQGRSTAHLPEAIQTLREMCAMLQRAHVTPLEVAERFGTAIKDWGKGDVTFNPRAEAFRAAKESQRASTFGAPDHVYRVTLDVADGKVILLSELERAFGKGMADESSLGWDVELPEPESVGPMNCLIHANVLGFGKPTAYVENIDFERGKLDEMGFLVPEGAPAGPYPPGLLPRSHPSRPPKP